MKQSFVLIACFLPLGIIYIVMKLAVWMSAVNAESDYVRQEPYENEDLMWKTHMRMLMKRKRSMEIAQTIDKALEEYYSEKGLSVPEWKKKKSTMVD